MHLDDEEVVVPSAAEEKVPDLGRGSEPLGGTTRGAPASLRASSSLATPPYVGWDSNGSLDGWYVHEGVFRALEEHRMSMG